MYAVIETGGKQYRVQAGDVIDIELLSEVGHRGSDIAFDRVLMVGGEDGAKVGAPVVEGARVNGVLLNRVRGPKVIVFKKKRRKQYRRTRGHRQDLMRVRIQGIEA
ncbi:MAG: 50S ribosomal protein L21 [Deltaproteobacteria bacterium]|nr:50S ribosomal protein L21 [Deltaproteobacteria bacterium]